jgi:outer membrane lipoprotein carrier protein
MAAADHGDGPAPRAPWKLRSVTFAAAGLALAGLVVGGMRTLELLMSALAGVHGVHVVPSVAAFDGPAPVDAAAEEPDDIPEAAPAPPAAEVVPDAPLVADAGHDAGPRDAGRRAAPVFVDAGIDVRVLPRTRLAACDVDLAHRVEDLYAPTTSFKATFEQELLVRALGSATQSRGSLLTAKPGRMSWSYDEPENSRIVSDGQTVSVYEAPDNRLFRVPAAVSPYPGAFVFLTGLAPLTDVFNFVARRPGATADIPGTCLLVGTPRALTRAYRKVLFYVDRATFQVRRVVILDAAGNENRIDLVDPSVDVPVSAADFVFVPPPDTVVVGR